MAHKSFSYKGYDIYLAAMQPSKMRNGKYHNRSLQIRKDSMIKKQFRMDLSDPYAFGKASKKATQWIDDKINENGK